ncbi:MAG TPA: sugar-binding domain-containing protein [Propionibacteriaceae bacterium]|nr:sugar-binding domain-containing protein [Propionibacteriaceae bacterium]
MAIRQSESGLRVADSEGVGQFAPSVLYTAARLYYEEDATQAEIALQLHTSRATVSRLLSEARRRGIVKIEVVPPGQEGVGDLAAQVAERLRLQAVYLSSPLPTPPPGKQLEDVIGSVLAPAVGRALQAVGLLPGEVLLVSSGRTMYEVARFDLPKLPGVVVAPTVGGTDQPEAWYQTNEITRRVAEHIGGRPTYLFAPALPGPDLYKTLLTDPAIQRVLHLWPYARCVLAGVGAPPALRSQIPQFVDLSSPALLDAVGDVCSRFFNRAGKPISFPGSERLIAVDLKTLQKLPTVIAVAAGRGKVPPIIAGAKARYFNQLVTDPATAQEVLVHT